MAVNARSGAGSWHVGLPRHGAKRGGAGLRRATRAATDSPVVRGLGRAGFVARGITYLLVGWIAIQIAVGHSGRQADRTGALQLVAATSYGVIVLWFLVLGFAGMAAWRLARVASPRKAASGGKGSRGDRAKARFGSLACALPYLAACAGTVDFLVAHQAKGSDQDSRDLTAQAMRHTGGRWLLAAVGAGLIVGGIVMLVSALRQRFASDLRRDEMSARQWRLVRPLGMVGYGARGVIVGVAGGFLLDAAVTFDPAKAKGVDATLRAFATAPYGRVLLVLVALGILAFGGYSWCEARWRAV